MVYMIFCSVHRASRIYNEKTNVFFCYSKSVGSFVFVILTLPLVFYFKISHIS